MQLDRLLIAAGLLNPFTGAAPDVSSLCYDSRAADTGSLFFALPGMKADGSEFVAQAAARGAVAIVSEAALVACALPVIVVPDARAAMARVAAEFHGNPSRELKVMGVTGTNGKTTTAFLTRHLLESNSLRCGLIGTIKYIVGGEEIPAPRTTPEAPDLQDMLVKMLRTGCRACAMEVSSHALAQHRTDSIAFDAAVFTNLTQDHLDYHKTMDDYFDAKALLFDQLARETAKKGRAIINADDRYGRRLVEKFEKSLNVLTYGQGVGADYRASNIQFDAAGASFKLDARGKSFLVRMPLIGLFNIYNSLAALATTASLGVELRSAVASLAQAPQVPGRLERVPVKRNFQVYVDYAHTDDALRNVLSTLRNLNPARLITVFGCGGDRDKAKRPLMARAAEEGSDFSILTSDNPRREDPEGILADIKSGMHGNRFETIIDREAAIRRAVEIATTGDIVLIAGKGHEAYQEFSDRKVPFDDVATAGRAMAEKKAEA